MAENLGSAETSKTTPICQTPFRFMPPFTAFGKIYLPERLYRDAQLENPTSETRAMIAHESTHIKRLGSSIRSYAKFWSDKDFRFSEELEAIKQEMKVLKNNKVNFNFEERAQILSGVGYLWCVNYEIAKQKLENIWEEI